jgi:chemotaxis protein MotB
LESIIGRSDSTVSALRKAVSDALLGFENKGLTIQQKGSRVYVSMDEQLLFASGSTIVEKKGEEALRKLSDVLAQNNDINVTVEGHTDDIPINGVLASGARDNWELSVLRATSVVKIILKGSTIDPNRITACGKGPYQPIDPAKTAEARKKNRRTEIILTPKLDALLNVLEQFGQAGK